MKVTILNKINNITATIDSFGAELISLKNISTNTEYIWQKNPQYWNKSSPVLFPFIGALKSNEYFYNEKKYSFPKKHGFARDNEFEIHIQKEDFVSFKLSSSKMTKEIFPFEFNFFINYSLKKNILTIEYIIENLDKNKLYFSLGNHPAFRLPISEDITLNDYFIEFEKSENENLYILNNSLFDPQKKLKNINNKIFNINTETFDNDVLILRNSNSKIVWIKNYKNNFKLSFKFEGFKHLGFWSKPQAEFICLEAWNGLPDYINHSGKLIEKKDIENLNFHEKYVRKIEIEI